MLLVGILCVQYCFLPLLVERMSLLVLVVKLSVDGFPLVSCKPMGLEAFVEIAMSVCILFFP